MMTSARGSGAQMSVTATAQAGRVPAASAKLGAAAEETLSELLSFTPAVLPPPSRWCDSRLRRRLQANLQMR